MGDLEQDDIRVFLRLLYDVPVELRQFVLRDMFERMQGLPAETIRSLVAASGPAFLPGDVAEIMDVGRLVEDLLTEDSERQSPCDFIVVTVKLTELYATQCAFGIRPDAIEDDFYRGIRFWATSVESRYGRVLEGFVCMAGEDSNVPMSAFLASVLERHRLPGLLVLVGMAAGIEGEVSLGDVVVATQVTDYLRSRVLPDGRRPRPRHVLPLLYSGRQILSFDPQRGGSFASRWTDFLAELDGEYLSRIPPTYDMTSAPIVHKGVILSGDWLVEDGQFQRWYEEHDDKVRAGEMEGAGFASLARESQVPWFVCRGIADFGLPVRTQDWQFVASGAAAVVARLFVENYRFTSEGSQLKDDDATSRR